MSDEPFQTEFEFTLPRGYRDDEGTLHREGVMRLARATDEIKPLTDPRVQSNPAYQTVLVLAAAITRLGSMAEVTPAVVEDLYVSDLAYLQDLYERVNGRGTDAVDVACPECGERFAVDRGSGAPLREADVPVPGDTLGAIPRPVTSGGRHRPLWRRR
jgi:hypothetical protein